MSQTIQVGNTMHAEWSIDTSSATLIILHVVHSDTASFSGQITDSIMTMQHPPTRSVASSLPQRAACDEAED